MQTDSPVGTREHRAETTAAHRDAVERAIGAMQADLAASHSINSLAQIACLSPFHFIRIFKGITGVSPGLFLAALRIEQAKKTLLYSDESITVAGIDAGYASLGTFSRIFRALVGLSPVEFRSRVRHYAPTNLLRDAWAFCRCNRIQDGPVLEGCVRADRGAGRIIFIGAFRKAIPQGAPLSGTILLAPGKFRMRSPLLRPFHLMAMQFPLDACPFDPLQKAEDIRVARTVVLGPGRGVELQLRPMQIYDPPVVVALPELLRARVGRGGAAPLRHEPRVLATDSPRVNNP